MFYVSKYNSPIGGITMASDGQSLTGLWFDGQKYFADNLPDLYEQRELPIFAFKTVTKQQGSQTSN